MISCELAPNQYELWHHSLKHQHHAGNAREALVVSEGLRRINASEYDRHYSSFRSQLTNAQSRLIRLQDADDNYFISVTHLLEIANSAGDLFERSTIDEKRQLIKIVPSNLRIEGKEIR